MKLIDRYVIEVGKHLPLLKGREDIEKELHSTLEDMLEDRSQKTGRPVDDTMELELLKEYGAPQKVAETYNPTPYLIGPRLFPTFLLLLKIVIGAVVLGLTIATGIQIVTQYPMTTIELFKAIGQGLLNILSASIAAFGNIALIFALIERFATVPDFEMGEDKQWDPASLQKEPEPQDVKMWEPILAIVFTFIVISIFNFNRQLLSLNYGDNGIWFVGVGDLLGTQKGSIPLFSEAFYRWLPLMNAAWVAEIILHGMLLRSGRWNGLTRLFSICIKVIQIAINVLLLTGPFILGITVDALTATDLLDADMAQTVVTALRQAMPILLGLGVFGKVIEITSAGYKAVTQKTSTNA